MFIFCLQLLAPDPYTLCKVDALFMHLFSCPVSDNLVTCVGPPCPFNWSLSPCCPFKRSCPVFLLTANCWWGNKNACSAEIRLDRRGKVEKVEKRNEDSAMATTWQEREQRRPQGDVKNTPEIPFGRFSVMWIEWSGLTLRLVLMFILRLTETSSKMKYRPCMPTCIPSLSPYAGLVCSGCFFLIQIHQDPF